MSQHSPTSSYHFFLQLVFPPAAGLVLCLAKEAGGRPRRRAQQLVFGWRHCRQASAACDNGGRGDDDPPTLRFRLRPFREHEQSQGGSAGPRNVYR
nr:unnamed protein product [Digitaria exilis]